MANPGDYHLKIFSDHTFVNPSDPYTKICDDFLIFANFDDYYMKISSDRHIFVADPDNYHIKNSGDC